MANYNNAQSENIQPARQGKLKVRPRIKKQTITAWMFLLPSLLGVTVFVLVPFVDTVRRSFFTSIGNRFVGFDNYISTLNNPMFLKAAGNTARFVSICVPVLILLSLLLAIMVRTLKPETGKWYKTTYLITMAIPVASIVLLWRALFEEKGILNGLLVAIGAQPVSFMYSNAAFWVLIFTYLWKNCGYDMILWLSGFDSINSTLYEAARVDGANERQVFRYVTLPGLLPSLFLISVLSIINTFKVFREAYLVAGKYPQDSIYLLQHLFNNWFAQMDISRLCAAAVMLAVVLLGIILLLKRAWGDEE